MLTLILSKNQLPIYYQLDIIYILQSFSSFSSSLFYRLFQYYSLPLPRILHLQICYNNLYIYQAMNMNTFRKKYIYNPNNPVYSSDTARTYNCMNNQTKEKRLIIIEHLTEPPFVEPAPGVLQPIEIPTSLEPFSVYPIVRCASEIGKVSEPEAMYILKCILESKVKNPAYCTISNQGICCSNVEGLLPNRSPELFQLAIDLLDLPANLQEVEKSVVSKEGYSICKALKNGDSPLASLQNYGWRDIKKQKQQVYDDDFFVFKGRRKQEGPFGEEYGLAWSNQHGLCRMKYISLVKDGFEEEFYEDFQKIMSYIQNSDTNVNKPLFLKVHKFEKSSSGIKIFTEIANQGSLSEYIEKKTQLKQTLTEKSCAVLLDAFVDNMVKFSKEMKAGGYGLLHIKSLFVHNNRICIGDPFLVTDKAEKKLRELKNSMDYFSPQLKQNIILPENLSKLNREKMDIWSFGFILHKIFAREIPVFDSSKKPIIAKGKISPGMSQLISDCLNLTAANRPSWNTINIKQIANKITVIEEVNQPPPEREEIKLGSRSQKRQQSIKTPGRKSRMVEELPEENQMKSKQIEEQNAKLKQPEEEEQVPYVSPIPTQISSRLKKIKLVVKIIGVVVLYIFVFFRMFLGNTINLMTVRNFYTTATLKLVDYHSTELSTVTVITNDALFFLKNDISFTEIQEKYQCINDKFDPIYNPTYSLLSYIHSSDFLGLLLAGWATAFMICIIKAISIWKGGISNRPTKNKCKFWMIYIFYELTMAQLLFAHFYIFEFFYFSGAVPCLSISSFTGLQPFFDSSLFLFLQNTQGYFQQVFSTLGVMSILLVVSSCFYAWGPKLDQKYFISIPSILLRIIPYLLLLLICRIGVFMLFAPTAINDSAQLLPAIINNSFQGFIGIIPEVFILITVAFELLIQVFMHWCERKASESDQLGKMFNVKDKKQSVSNDVSRLNDMSIINNSKHKLDPDEDQQ